MGGKYRLTSYTVYPAKSRKDTNRNAVGSVSEIAQNILGLTEEQADRLFFLPIAHEHHEQYSWPAKFEQRYNAATTLEAKAKVAVERIEHFIKTKGRE
jgi:hypothetical protein